MGLFDNFKKPTFGHSQTPMHPYLQMAFYTSWYMESLHRIRGQNVQAVKARG